MKIVVPAIGSRGDVQPYIALCQGLQQAGHQVTLATNPTMCSLVSSYGVNCAPVGPPVDMGLEGAKIWARAGKNWWLGFIRVMRFGFSLVQQAYPDILALCRDAHLVVTTDTAAGSAEADKLSLPWVSVTLQPARIPVPSPSFVARVLWSLVGNLMMAPLNRFRRRVGAPTVKGLSGVLSTCLTLLPVSPHVAPPDPRWPPYVYMTGYWFARSPLEWTPPDELLAFLEAGERPIAVSLGVMSLAGEATREAACITLEALSRAGVRAVVQGWDEVLAGAELPDTVYHTGPLPHTWLFDRVSAVVHHGGFGTTASALRAGVPAVVVPHIIDQIYWGQRVYELGVGPKFIHRASLKVDTLAEAIAQVAGDGEMRARAAQLGAHIRAETGVENAVRLIGESV
jgi:sterol 3beta-glucosyltransferase